MFPHIMLANAAITAAAIGASGIILTAFITLILGVRNSNQAARNANDSRSAELDKREAQITTQLSDTVKDLRQANEQVVRQLRQAESDLAGYREQMRAREDEIYTLKATLRTREQEVIQCRERLAQVEAKNSEGARRITELEAAVRVLKETFMAPPAGWPPPALHEQLENLRRGGPPLEP